LAIWQVAAEGGPGGQLVSEERLDRDWDAAAAATDHDRGGDRMAGVG
jgi:hypothetical protein